MENRYDLSRFHKAQEGDCANYSDALSEIRAGHKCSHWIWYIFPQLRGLGVSWMSDYYGIENLEEAKAYLGDPDLRSRLLEISGELLRLDSCDPREVMGAPDDRKLRSSMTLFSMADPGETVFHKVLEKYYNGIPDRKTVDMLS